MNMTPSNRIPIVLVVDDNPKNLQIIALTLRDLNYKLMIADTGPKAIELSERYKADLILLDVMMPGMDGFEVCQIIKSKKENEGIPIIFLTALSEKTNLVRGFELGAVDYITKPFNKEELISRIKNHLELKFARDDLKSVTNHLTELNSIKDKMFSVIGHDLRSPIGSVKMSLDMLSNNLEKYDIQKLRENINLLSKTTDEVFSLLENLLWWARSQSGNLSVIPENVELLPLFTSLYYLNKTSLGLKNIEFVNTVDDSSIVYSDMNTLKTVLRNLISNAIKFTPNGGKITVSSESFDDHVLINIEDNGVGIPEDVIAKLFDEKFQITSPGTNMESGSGLGLLLCKNFITVNNGTISVESHLGKGSVFKLSLPAKKTEIQ